MYVYLLSLLCPDWLTLEGAPELAKVFKKITWKSDVD